MSFDRPSRVTSERHATALRLEELAEVQPRHVRGKLAPGQRFPSGERAGRGRAQSLDFDGISPYVPGDDVRWIEWRATARSGRAQVKRFAAQSHRARMIVIDLRPDLYFGTRDRLMAKTAALVGARLGWESLALQEPVGLAVPGFEPIHPRRGKRHLLRLLNHLLQCYDVASATQPTTSIAEVIEEACALVHRGDELTLVSDFGEQDPAFDEVSRTLADIRVLRAFAVEDPFTRTPIRPGRYPVHVPGGGDRRVLHIGRREGAEAPATAERMRHEMKRSLRDLGWEVVDALSMLPRQKVLSP